MTVPMRRRLLPPLAADPGSRRPVTVRSAFLRPLLLPLLLALAVTLTVAWSVRTTVHTAALARDAQVNLTLLQTILNDVIDLETGQRGYLITHQQSYLEPYHQAKVRLPQDLAALRQALSSQDPAGRTMPLPQLNTLEARISEWERQGGGREVQVERLDPARAAQMVRTGRGKALIDDARRIIARFQADELQVQQRLDVMSSVSAQQALLVTVAGLLLAIALAVTSAVRAASRVTVTLRQLSVASAQLARGHLPQRLPASDIRELDDLAQDFTVTGQVLQAREAALRDGQERLELVTRHAPVLLFSLDAAGTFTFCEGRGQGGQRGELLGRSAFDVYAASPEALPLFRAALRGERAEGRVTDGAEVFLMRLNPLHDARGAVRSVVGVTVDVTELERARAALARANTELEQFAAIASHDLQTPLRSIMSFAQLLDRRAGVALDDRSRVMLQHIVNASGRMKTLIDDLLQYARLAQTPPQQRDIDPNQVLAEVLADLQEEISAAAVQVTSDPLPVVLADHLPVRQLLFNLILNAVRYRRAEVPGSVHVSGRREGSEVRIDVTDNGQGIDPQFHERIFTVFQRLHRQDEVAGTGIGLAACKRIAEAYGGRITVDSRPGHGSTFTFTLPAAPDGRAPAAALG
ncbi:ATP-binding protein [Deinococcus sonorensis]|uniref:histidine kinase n=2 Tax=Deinococcus sonorensis TaxID=309891 RepID=A0AAU7U786_9DEIO